MRHRFPKGSANPAHFRRVDYELRNKISESLKFRAKQGLRVGRPRLGEDSNSSDGLNVEGRAVVRMRDEGVPLREIARRVGWSRNAVKRFLGRHK